MVYSSAADYATTCTPNTPKAKPILPRHAKTKLVDRLSLNMHTHMAIVD